RIISELGSDDVVGPSGFPSLISLAGIGLGGWLFVRPDRDGGFAELRRPTWFYWLGFCLYALLIPWIGFGISPALFLSAVFMFLRTPALHAIMIAVAVSFGLWFVFARLLGVRIHLMPGIL